jgi:hypothetical protein
MVLVTGGKQMAGQMRWRRDEAGNMQLQLKTDALSPWQSYRGHRSAVSDPPHFSPGFATFAALLKQGWIALGKDE